MGWRINIFPKILLVMSTHFIGLRMSFSGISIFIEFRRIKSGDHLHVTLCRHGNNGNGTVTAVVR